MASPEQADEARAWLLDKGWDVLVEERDRREELIREGFVGLATNNHTHWAHLISVGDPHNVVRNYGSGKTESEAVLRARQRYGSEQT